MYYWKHVCIVVCPICAGEDTDGSTTNSSYGPRLLKTFEESREYLALKQHLDTQLNTALNKPQGESPKYATSFLWQVRVYHHVPCISSCVSIQFNVLTIRTIRNLVRNRLFSGVQVCFNMLSCCISLV